MTHVLLISHELIPSVRLCGYAQYTRMQELGKLEFRFTSAREITPALAGWADVVQFVRSDSKAELRCAKALRHAGKYLIYTLDDDLLEIPDGFGSSAYYHRKNVQRNIREIMAQCHCLLSPSAHLSEKYGSGFERICRIEEPALYEVPPSDTRESNEKIRIGFAGSVDRAGDLDVLLSETLTRIHEELCDRVSIEFFGARPELVDKLSARHIPYSDSYENYQKTMRELGWDIGLAPMPDSLFHRGKHYNKFIEYSAAGIVGVYSDLPPYRGAVEQNQTGLLCENTPEAFYAAIKRLVNDPMLLADLRRRVVSLARGRFSLDSVTVDLETELGEILTHETSHKPIKSLKKLKITDYAERIRAGIGEMGFFPYVFQKSGKIFKKLFSRRSAD